MEKIALLPGGFKPPHAGHYNMAKWLASNTDADTVVVKVGAKERDGITRGMSLQLWDLYRSTDPDPLAKKLTILPSDSNSPVRDVYDFIEQNAPENSTIYLGMGEKDMDDARFANIGKFAEPKGITFETTLVPPQAGGVSGTEMRTYIKKNKFQDFRKYIPDHLTAEQTNEAWALVTGNTDYSSPKGGTQSSQFQEDLYDPNDHYRDFAKTNDPNPKKPVPSNYKYRDGGLGKAAYYKRSFGENTLIKESTAVIHDKFIPLEVMDTPELQVQGMMGRSKLKGGMVFPYNDLAKRTFHMENCKIPLDILFISNNEINKIDHSAPPCKGGWCPKYLGKADTVLELPGGYCKKHNVNIGDSVGINLFEIPKILFKEIINELSDKEIKMFAMHADILKQLNTPNFKLKFVELQQELEGERLEALEYFWNEYFSKLEDSCEIEGSFEKKVNETKYGAHDLISQYKEKIQLDYGHQQYRNLQLMLSQNQDEEVNNWLKSKGYINEEKPGLWANIRAKRKSGKPMAKKGSKAYKTAKKAGDKINKETNEIYYIDSIDEIQMIEDALNEEYCPSCANKREVIEEKKGKCTPTKGKRFAKRVNGKCRSFGQKGKAKKGGDRIRPGTKKGHAYCARSAKIKKCKNPPCANALSRKKWKCQGSRSVAESSLFSKDWWSNVITEYLLTEGGAAGHMAHPFNLSNVNSGKDLKDIFNKSAESLNKNPGSVKIDGVNSSIRLVDLDGQKQFVMDRGSKKPLDIKGITKADLEDRFKPGHGMVKVGGEVLDMFNEALPSLEADLKKLGAWDDSNILFNMEYVSGKTNVQDYGSNFIAIHGLNKVESKEVQGKRKMLVKRSSTEIPYDKAALQSMLDNLKPVAEKNDFEVYGSVPTEMKKKPNFSAALSKTYTIKSNDGDKTQSLDAWLSELNDIPEKDFIFIYVNDVKKKVGAVSKQVYTTLLSGGNIDELYKSEEDKQKAMEGFVTYLATEKLGDEILKVLDSPMGTVDNHEGVVIRDKNITTEPFKITGKFILGGMVSDF